MDIRISRVQMLYLMFWLIMATGILTMPLAIAHFTIRDGWISGLLFIIGAGIAAGMSFLYTSLFPSTSLTDALLQVFGPYIGRLLCIWLLVWLGINTAMMARQFLLFAEISILPQTPLPLIASAFYLPIAYAVFLGIETLGRFTEFFTPITLLIIGFLITLTLPDVEFQSVTPILADGWSPVVRSAIQPGTSFAFQLVLVLQLLPHLRHPETVARDLLGLGVFIGIFLCATELVIVSILGGSSNYLQYPILEVVRGIQIGRFFQRFDTLYVMGIIAVIFIKVTLYQYLFTTSIKSVFKFSSIHPLVLPGTALTGAACIFFWHNSHELSEYMLLATPSYFTITLIGLPLLVVIGQTIKQSFRRQNE